MKPWKDDGLNFILFYYEHLLRQELLLERASRGTTVQYWTPNKTIFDFDYANEVTLDECRKRNIEVNFGWELLKV